MQSAQRIKVGNIMMGSGRVADLDWADICMWTAVGRPVCLGRMGGLMMAFRQRERMVTHGMSHIRGPCLSPETPV